MNELADSYSALYIISPSEDGTSVEVCKEKEKPEMPIWVKLLT